MLLNCMMTGKPLGLWVVDKSTRQAPTCGGSPDTFSMETARMFRNDARLKADCCIRYVVQE